MNSSDDPWWKGPRGEWYVVAQALLFILIASDRGLAGGFNILPQRAVEHEMAELAARGVRLHVVFGAYGQERDDLVRRSRLVLCLHSYESSILELARLSYLWANGVPVACEIGPQTEDALAMAGHCHSAPADGIVDLVVDLLNDRERVEVGAVTARARLRDRADAAALLRVALEDPAIVA